MLRIRHSIAKLMPESIVNFYIYIGMPLKAALHINTIFDEKAKKDFIDASGDHIATRWNFRGATKFILKLKASYAVRILNVMYNSPKILSIKPGIIVNLMLTESHIYFEMNEKEKQSKVDEIIALLAVTNRSLLKDRFENGPLMASASILEISERRRNDLLPALIPFLAFDININLLAFLFIIFEQIYGKKMSLFISKFPQNKALKLIEEIKRIRKDEVLQDINIQTHRRIDNLIVRTIEFSPEHIQSGVQIIQSLMNAFNKMYPDSKTNIQIKQEDLKIVLVIDPLDCDPQDIEKRLAEIGKVFSGEIRAEDVCDSKEFQNDMELQRKLREAAYSHQEKLIKEKDYGIQDKQAIFEKNDEEIQKLKKRFQQMEEKIANLCDLPHKTIIFQTQNISQSGPNSLIKQISAETTGDEIIATVKGDMSISKDNATSTISKNCAIAADEDLKN